MECPQCQHLAAELETLKTDHAALQAGTRDSAATNEATIKELRRLLDKESNMGNILNSELAPDPLSPACGQCIKNYAQVKAVREANAAEYRFVVHFHKTARSLQLELQTALAEQKTRFMQLRVQYDELAARKLDPLCRDTEVTRLKAEALEAKRLQGNANQTALMANRAAETFQKELNATQQRAEALETEKIALSQRVANLEEALEAYKRDSELSGCTVMECRDYVCRKRVMDEIAKQKELCEQIRALQQEKVQCQSTIFQLRQEDAPVRKAAKTAPLPKTIVADLARAPEELGMNLRSYFTIFPGWAEEEADDAELFDDFVSDVEPKERDANMKWMLAACGLEAGDAKALRRCFGACLQAMGGLCRKRGTKTVWCNVRRNRAPIFRQQ